MTDRRRNILWICTDQQRFDTLGCTGNPFVSTPHIDRLAADGIVFERCFAQSTVCTPSRVSFMTGRYPRTTGCRQNGQNIPRDEKLITRILSDAGYVCGLAGRLHIHPGASGHLCPTPEGLSELRGDDGYSDFHWGGAPKQEGTEYNLWLKKQDISPELRQSDVTLYVHRGVEAKHDMSTWCADRGIAFIENQAESDRPWLFSLNLFAPHHPFSPPAEYLERYRKTLSEIPLPSFRIGELDNKPEVQRNDHHGAYNRKGFYPFSEMEEKDHRWIRAAYWAMVDHIDAQIGRMIEALDRTGQRDSTLIIFHSDHGEMLGDHGIYLKGPYFYDPAVRVPLIISGSGIVKGKRSSALVQLMDLAPTVLAAAGVPLPAGMQAKSLWPMLAGEASLSFHHDSVYSEYYNAMPFHEDPRVHATMVATGEAK
ncbi:MAG: sulfatase-like hydrolase/transferase, partial [Spirochaetaceae bacterium]|nr:sulfatase-like hydrolase/transferase [Spirochaetaceae bacterium]